MKYSDAVGVQAEHECGGNARGICDTRKPSVAIRSTGMRERLHIERKCIRRLGVTQKNTQAPSQRDQEGRPADSGELK